MSDIIPLFRSYFSDRPDRLSFAPGRINLIGEHIDYMGGFVTPAAINRGVTVLGKSNDNSKTLNVWASDMNESFSIVEQDLHQTYFPSWKRYLIGALKEIQNRGLPFWTGSLMIKSDLAQGSGLSSSAALEIALLNFFFSEANYSIHSLELAQLAQTIENKYVGTQCGIMDQYASVHGKENHFMLLNCQDLEHRYIKWSDHQRAQLILINSMVSHELGEQYNEIRYDLETAETLIAQGPLISLKENSLNHSKSQLTLPQVNKALYVIQESKRVQSFCDAIHINDYERAGHLLSATHKGLSEQMRVSTKEIDDLIQLSSSFQGWYGGRLMGGGFGGCTLNLIDPKYRESYIDQIKIAYKHKHDINAEVYEIKLSQGAYTQKLS